MTQLVLSDPDDVRAALDDPRLVPHGTTDRSTGSTIRLRQAMARFSQPDDHPARRAAVVAGIEHFRLETVAAIATSRTVQRLTGRRVDAVGAIARVVPTEVLTICLGAPDGLEQLLADVEAIVRVIGRGAPADAGADAAADRLLARFAQHPAGDIPAVSMLYQNFDATTALVTANLLAMATGQRPVAAVPRTRRVATSTTQIGRHTIAAGTDIALEIGTAGLPFGSGLHECPGRLVAEHIVSGITSAVATSAYLVDLQSVELDADGRPIALQLVLR